MPQFHYTALLATGESQTGQLTADSRQAVLEQLRTAELFPMSVTEHATSARRHGRVPSAAMAGAFGSLADLLESGVPLMRSLTVLVDQTSHPTLQAVLSDVRRQVSDGRSLAQALRDHPGTFNSLAISMVHAGEEGGFLEDSLKRVATFAQKQEELRGKIVGALAYPAFLTGVGALVVTGMLIFFVPRFEPLFARMRDKGELPWMTTALLDASALLGAYAGWMLAGFAVVGVFAVRQLRSPELQGARDALLLRLPGAGSVIRGFAVSRFCRVLGTLLTNGVPMLKSLDIARGAAGNRVLSDAVAAASENVSSGRTLSAPLAGSGQFPTEVIEMLRVAETSNRLESVLLTIADRLEQRTQNRLDLAVKMLEPLLMLVMAVVIGFLVVALLMPVLTGGGGLG
jgi:general secretion pathway protein F